MDLTNNIGGSPSSLISSNYNHMAMPRAIYDQAGLHNLGYDYAGRLVSEAFTNGSLSGIVLTYHYDPVNGKDRLVARNPNATLMTNQFGFDSYGRIASASDGGNLSASYSYLANSDLIQSVTFKSNNLAKLVTTKTWDFGSRLRSISSSAGSAVVSSHSYLYDDLDRRTEDHLEDGSVWLYGYNDRDELIRGHCYWSDWSPVSGQRFEYQYDAIGNRMTSSAGGDTTGANLRSATTGRMVSTSTPTSSRQGTRILPARPTARRPSL